MTESRRRFSVSARITALTALLSGLALAGAGGLVYVLESNRIERDVNSQITQEIAEFRTLRDGTDPQTGKPFTSAERLIELFLGRNVPDDDELLVSYVDGTATGRTANRYGDDVFDVPAYRQALEEVIVEGGTRRIDSDAHGEVWVTAVPVRDDQVSAALVMVNFVDDEHEELNNTMRTYAIVGFVAWLVITLIAFLQSGRLLAPLRILRRAADEITASDLSLRIEERGNDDITELTRTMNAMLDRLESGFRSQRQFLDDAGHELKTPLTVVSGHLEVMDSSDPADVDETRGLVLDEVDRMSRLVGDLILLAKSRRPDFVRPEQVELGPFSQQLLAKARVLGDRSWRLESMAEGTARIDAQRLTQAVLQLVDNAVKHTDSGEEIALGTVLHHDGAFHLWVRDTGDGVREQDREQIFERFGRSRVRPGDEGFGLGLSIVHAIAVAHGGTVGFQPVEPRGSRFEIVINQEETWRRS